MVKTEELRARCTLAELKALQVIAQQEGRQPGEMLREVVRQYAQQAGIWPVVLTEVQKREGQPCEVATV